MCLLIAYSRVVEGAPLLLAGNRDELLARPAKPMDRLSEHPLILGGRDLVAGGTWMAVGASGVVAALTNRPPADPSQRVVATHSRGVLPLVAASHATAAEGAAALAATVDPRAYNPCWLLVGDRDDLFYLEIAAGVPVEPLRLPPGLYVLENRPLGAASPKVDHVRSLLPTSTRLGAGLLPALQAVLSNRTLPDSVATSTRTWPPPAVEAASVRAGPYGTRWSGIVTVGARVSRPRFLFADGPAGEAPFQRAPWSTYLSK